MDQAFEPVATEIDDDYVFSPFVGVGLFLTGSVDTAILQATIDELRRQRQEDGLCTLPQILGEGRRGPRVTSC